MSRVALGLGALAFGIALAYAFAVQPAWEPRHDDQRQYLALARGLATRGEFTRAVPGEPFIPESLRLPGYPLFVAATCRPGCDHWTIAVAQAALLAAAVLLAFDVARRLAGRRGALAGAALVAVFLPLSYSAALVLSEILAVVLLLAAVAAWLRVVERRSLRWAIVAGLCCGGLALTRAAFVPFGLGLAAMLVLIRGRAALPRAAVLVLACGLVLLPYVRYSIDSFGALVGTSGHQLWLGYMQTRDLGTLDPVERLEADATSEEGRRLEAIADRVAQARAWPALDASLGARARRLIAHDLGAYASGALPRSAELWGGAQVVPDAWGTPPVEIRLLVAATLLALFGVGVAGALALWRGSASPASPLPALVIAYVWLTAVPFHTEGRYALPAWPFVLLAIPAGISALRRAARRAARRIAREGRPAPGRRG